MREYTAYIVDTEFVWGYQTNVAGLSKTPPSFTYPPPTTFLGAITEAIAKRKGLGESSYIRTLNELVEPLLAIAIKPKNIYPLKTLDINRVIAVRSSSVKLPSGKSIQVQHPDPEHIDKAFDAPARGKTVASPVGGPPTITWILVFAKEPASLDARDLWRIHRLGTKESVVSVTRVEKTKATVAEEGKARTEYSVPLRYVKSFVPKIGSEWIIESYADPFRPFNGDSPATRYVAGDTVLFALPLNKGSLMPSVASVEVGEGGAVYRVGKASVVGVMKG